jgi:hypothetical protein
METAGELHRASGWRRVGREVFPLVVLFAATVKALFGEWQVHDLTACDEAYYLAVALFAQEGGPVGIEVGPLYVLWYRALLLLPIPIEYLSHVSHGLLLGLLSVLFYALARRLGVGRWPGAAATALLILNTRLTTTEPFPVHLATALFAGGVLVGTYRRSLLGACGPIGFGILAACYARPEFGTLLLVFLPCYLAVGTWALWRADCREFLPWAIPLVVATAACGWMLSVPLPSGNRGWDAFAQHYARNVVEASGGNSEGWTQHWEATTRKEFGEARSLSQAVRTRPGAVAWHVERNLTRLPNAAVRLCGPDEYRLPTTLRVVQSACALVVLAVCAVGVIRRVRSGGLYGPEGQPLRAVLLALACVALVSGPAVLVVYPRDHYLLLPLFFSLVLVVSGLPALAWPGWLGAPTAGKVRFAALAAAVLIVGATPTGIGEWTFLRPLKAPSSHFDSNIAVRRDTLALLHSLPRRPGTVVMDYRYWGDYQTLWMMPPVTLISHESKGEGFRAFVAKHRIQVVVLERELLTDPRFAHDPEFMALWNGTDSGEFVVRSRGAARVAVRREFLSSD